MGKFLQEVEHRIYEKGHKGWTHWWRISDKEYRRRIIDNLDRGDLIDVAGLALVMWAKKRNKESRKVNEKE
jgi:hypothetical protein